MISRLSGWAVYAEILAWEMGLDGDPANLQRLKSRLLRTVRLVVDTRHPQGWTWIKPRHTSKGTGMPQSYAGLTRYLVNPGYASGYNIGGLKMLEMRRRAMEKLGDRFDIKEFHNVVLGSGIVPIGVLEGVVGDWIDREMSGSFAGTLAQLDGLPLDEFLGNPIIVLQLRDPDALFINSACQRLWRSQ